MPTLFQTATSSNRDSLGSRDSLDNKVDSLEAKITEAANGLANNKVVMGRMAHAQVKLGKGDTRLHAALQEGMECMDEPLAKIDKALNHMVSNTNESANDAVELNSQNASSLSR